jgi:2-iminobutanoate/2-iminopropanoate deaminase
MNIFTTDVRYHRDINETRREVLGSNFPTSTMVQVVALARPELMLEINATAVIA